VSSCEVTTDLEIEGNRLIATNIATLCTNPGPNENTSLPRPTIKWKMMNKSIAPV
jgi:hypothetical protein